MPRRDESIQIGHDVPPEVIASIEASSKMTIDDLKANPELVQFAVDRAKKSGNDAFKAGRMRDAVRMYTQAIAGAPGDAALHDNRDDGQIELLREAALEERAHLDLAAPVLVRLVVDENEEQSK